MATTSLTLIGRKNDIVIQKIDDELLIYDLISNKAFCLNYSAAVIWEGCDGKSSIAAITRNAGKKLNTTLPQEFVTFALTQMVENGLIDLGSGDPVLFDRMSRRNLVRKLGLASAVAIPLIASIVAPQTINAQSSACISVPSGCQCNPGFMSGDDCTGSTQAGMACASPLCRCIASPGLDDCMP